MNLTNWSTVEFRMFRGTLKYNTLIATLQLVDRICSLGVDLDDEQLQGLAWMDFVSFIGGQKYGELITYLKEFRLYINEPIEAEEDI